MAERKKNKDSVSSRLLQEYMKGSDTMDELIRYLDKKGLGRKSKTVYGWSAGQANPTPETFLHICRFYGIENPYNLIEEYRLEDEEQGRAELSEDEKWLFRYIRTCPSEGEALIAFLKEFTKFR